MAELKTTPFKNMLDIGCGDGSITKGMVMNAPGSGGLFTQRVKPLTDRCLSPECALDRQGVKALGIDISPVMLDHAQKTHSFNDVESGSSLQFRVLDATELPQEVRASSSSFLKRWCLVVEVSNPFYCCWMDAQDEFDMVVSFNCFHWIPNQEALWKSVHRAMKKGGKFKAVRILPSTAPLSLDCP